MASTTEEPRSGRLSRLEWIEAVLDALVESGIEGVRIDRLCRALGVTKGSFYHHFSGREALLDAVADYWSETQPRQALNALAATPGDPMQQLVEITKLGRRRETV